MIKAAYMERPRIGTQIIKWEPQGAVDGGFVIQHVKVYQEYRTTPGGNLVKEVVANYWEAWEVDKGGRVYKGYISELFGPFMKTPKGDVRLPSGRDYTKRQIFHVQDRFSWDIPGPKTCGFFEMTGHARYVEKYEPVNNNGKPWLARGVPEAGDLPSTDVMPRGWTDDNTVKHGFKITWDDFDGVAPRIAESWP